MIKETSYMDYDFTPGKSRVALKDDVEGMKGTVIGWSYDGYFMEIHVRWDDGSLETYGIRELVEV